MGKKPTHQKFEKQHPKTKEREAAGKVEDKYKLLVEHANDAIFVLQDGQIKYANPKALEIGGVLAEEVHKIPFMEYLHPEEKNIVIERHEKRLKGEKILNMYPLRIINRQGEVVWTEVNAVLIEWEDRPATLNIIRDITSQKLIEAQYYQTESLATLRTFSGGLAHSFNNLLMGIMGRVSLLSREIDKNDWRYEHLKGIELCIDEAAKLTKQMLGFAQSGKYKVTHLDIHQVIDEVVNTFNESQKTITFKKEYQPRLRQVEADKNQMEQVIFNLLLNAWEATCQQGLIVIKTENFELAEARCDFKDIQAGKYVKISIRDTGVGMDESVRKRAFEPFFTTKEIGKHRGLGLSSVYGIVANHDGIINLDSVSNFGTTVTLFLPAVTAPKSLA